MRILSSATVRIVISLLSLWHREDLSALTQELEIATVEKQYSETRDDKNDFPPQSLPVVF